MKVQVHDFDGDLYDALIERGWEGHEFINKERAFDEFCEWHGLIDWGPRLRHVWDEAVTTERECT